LRLQEGHGSDVIFLLFACWLPGPLPAARWAALHTASRNWNRTVTCRIRALRRRIRETGWPQGYGNILKLELASERVEATWLARAADQAGGPIGHPDLARRIKRLFPELPSAERNALCTAIHPLLP
jgi:uncharacterized protein (TIGR02444 family)